MVSKKILTLIICIITGCITIVCYYPTDTYAYESKNTENDEDNFDDLGEDDQFFDNEKLDIDYKKLDTASSGESAFSIGGFIKQESAYSYNKPSPYLSKLRTTLQVNTDMKFNDKLYVKIVSDAFYDAAYTLKGRDDFTEETLDGNEDEIRIKDFYIDGILFYWMQLKIGRQVIPWGDSEYFQITDLANPRDLREPGMLDMENIRIPVFASKLSLFKENWEMNLVAVHEIKSNLTAPSGSDFDPLKEYRKNGFRIVREEIPDSSIDNTELLIRIAKQFNGGEISIVGAQVYDDEYYLDLTDINTNVSQPEITLTPKHKKIQAFGISGNIISGSTQYKFEASHTKDSTIMRNDLSKQVMAASGGNLPDMWCLRDTIQGMLGFEYTGIEDLSVVVEGYLRHINDYDSYLHPKEDTEILYLMAIYNMLHSTMTFNLQFVHFFDYSDSFYRLSGAYDISDSLTAEVGIIVYDINDSDLGMYSCRREDWIYTSIKYSF